MRSVSVWSRAQSPQGALRHDRVWAGFSNKPWSCTGDRPLAVPPRHQPRLGASCLPLAHPRAGWIALGRSPCLAASTSSSHLTSRHRFSCCGRVHHTMPEGHLPILAKSQGSTRRIALITETCCIVASDSSLAQLAEHALRKRMVAGSIPAGGSSP